MLTRSSIMFWLKNSSQSVRLRAGQGPAGQLMSPGVWSDTITVLTIRAGLGRSLDHCNATGGGSSALVVIIQEPGRFHCMNMAASYSWGAECCQALYLGGAMWECEATHCYVELELTKTNYSQKTSGPTTGRDTFLLRYLQPLAGITC